jgi:hypothetical protein
MVDLVLRPSGLGDERRGWALQLRYHESVGPTEYVTITRVSVDAAREIIRAGAARWMFGAPEDTPPPEQCLAPETARLARIADLKAERAQLVADNEKAAAWGAAVGARGERIAAIENALQELEPSNG